MERRIDAMTRLFAAPRLASYLLWAAARSPWEAAVVCEQRADRAVSTLRLPNGSVADCCPGELAHAMCGAAVAVWAGATTMPTE